MAIRLDEVVLWGRCFDDYLGMFNLTDSDFASPILGCADGPASFNAVATAKGYSVISCDPIYEFSASQLEPRIDTSYDIVMNQIRAHPEDFVWKNYKDIDYLGRRRMACMREFLGDLEQGKTEGRYLVGSLPSLPFADNQFELALSAHLLFTYTEQFSFDFHRSAIEELLRVASEVRLFPVLDLNWNYSKHLAPLQQHFGQKGYQTDVEDVAYDFLKAGNQMLRITKQ